MKTPDEVIQGLITIINAYGEDEGYVPRRVSAIYDELLVENDAGAVLRTTKLEHHACPLCQCKWNPDHAPSQWVALTDNVKRMATEITRLRKRKKT